MEKTTFSQQEFTQEIMVGEKKNYFQFNADVFHFCERLSSSFEHGLVHETSFKINIIKTWFILRLFTSFLLAISTQFFCFISVIISHICRRLAIPINIWQMPEGTTRFHSYFSFSYPMGFSTFSSSSHLTNFRSFFLCVRDKKEI
jgi:hypothetical protein